MKHVRRERLAGVNAPDHVFASSDLFYRII